MTGIGVSVAIKKTVLHHVPPPAAALQSPRTRSTSTNTCYMKSAFFAVGYKIGLARRISTVTSRRRSSHQRLTSDAPTMGCRGRYSTVSINHVWVQRPRPVSVIAGTLTQCFCGVALAESCQTVLGTPPPSSNNTRH